MLVVDRDDVVVRVFEVDDDAGVLELAEHLGEHGLLAFLCWQLVD